MDKRTLVRDMLVLKGTSLYYDTLLKEIQQ